MPSSEGPGQLTGGVNLEVVHAGPDDATGVFVEHLADDGLGALVEGHEGMGGHLVFGTLFQVYGQVVELTHDPERRHWPESRTVVGVIKGTANVDNFLASIFGLCRRLLFHFFRFFKFSKTFLQNIYKSSSKTQTYSFFT